MASIKDLREEVYKIIDRDNPIQVQRADDYIYDVELIRRLQRQVRKDGEVTEIINGSQSYHKEHPALNQIDKASKRIRAFEKEFLEVNRLSKEETHQPLTKVSLTS